VENSLIPNRREVFYITGPMTCEKWSRIDASGFLFWAHVGPSEWVYRVSNGDPVCRSSCVERPARELAAAR